MKDWEGRFPHPPFSILSSLSVMESTGGIVDWNSTLKPAEIATRKEMKAKRGKPYEQELVIARKLTGGREEEEERETDWLTVNDWRKKKSEWRMRMQMMLYAKYITEEGRNCYEKDKKTGGEIDWVENSHEGVRMGLGNWNAPQHVQVQKKGKTKRWSAKWTIMQDAKKIKMRIVLHKNYYFCKIRSEKSIRTSIRINKIIKKLAE